MLRLVVVFSAAGIGLLLLADFANAPLPDETAHLAAGLSCWQVGSFDLYAVNPPLVRVVAAAPVVLLHHKSDWSAWDRDSSKRDSDSRPEWSVGIGFVRRNQDRARWLFAVARWACLPFSLIGVYFCWRWARELYGDLAGIVAIVLWIFSPNILTWSATICPDAAATALGVAAGYYFWRWLREPDWVNALTVGVVVGLAQLTKMTWVFLFALWPIIWFLWQRTRPRSAVAARLVGQSTQLAAAFTVAILVLNTGYGLEGSLTRLGKFTFVSRTLAADGSPIEGGQGGNRFADTWLADVPVPVPYNYLRGADLQKYDFERGLPSYLCGQWRDRGWWYYYLVCAVLKVPLGTWCLGALALAVSLRGMALKAPNPSCGDAAREASDNGCYSWRDEMVLLLPAVVLFIFVSSQTGFSRHFRYVLPGLPFLFIWISKLTPMAIRRPRSLGVLFVGLLTWSVTSSLWIYPHSMSYFNELVGGPRNGDKYVLDSNLDWGQDVFYLKRWREKHAAAVPVNTLLTNSYAADLVGTRGLGEWSRQEVAAPIARLSRNEDAWARAPFPGWYATSIRRIHDADGDYLYFLNLQPVATAGYGFRIYHISLEEANRVRSELGAPLLPNDWCPRDIYPPPNEETRAFVTALAKSAQDRKNLETRIRVALFRQDPHDDEATATLNKLLDDSTACKCFHVSPEDIRSGGLDRCDVVVFPGGGGGAMAQSLGADGCQAVRDFVSRGGGYVGICGGAYLATAKYDWSLGLVNAKTLTGTINVPAQGERSMAARGAGVVKMELTTLGEQLFGQRSGPWDVQFSSGPVLSPADVADLPPYAPLAIYGTETWLHEQQRGTMIGTPAIVAAPFGQGRVILFSPHPETSEGLAGFMATAARAVTP